MPKAKGYISPRHHARAAGEAQSWDDQGEPKFSAINPGDTVSQKVYDALWGEEAAAAAGAAPAPAPAADLAGKSMKDLKAMAKDRGLTGYSRLSKANLIQRLSS